MSIEVHTISFFIRLRVSWDTNDREAVDILALTTYLQKMLDRCAII